MQRSNVNGHQSFDFQYFFIFFQDLLPRFVRLFFVVVSSGSLTFAQDTASAVKPGIEIPDTLLFKIEKAQAVITQINAANKKGYNIAGIQAELRDVKENVAQINAAVDVDAPLPNSKDLLNYRHILNNVQHKTGQWRKELSAHNAELQRMSTDVVEFGRDSMLAVQTGDTTQKKLYSRQILDLKEKLQVAGQVTTASLDTVSELLANVSEVYFLSNELGARIDDYIADAGRNVLEKESDYLWNAPTTFRKEKSQNLLRVSYSGQNKILRYFFQSTWDNRVLLILMCIGFFVWVFVNFKRASGPKTRQAIGDFDFKFITPRPYLATLIVLFNLTPLFEPRSPSIYIEINQFLLLLTLTIFFMKKLHREQLVWWFSMLVLYLLTVVTNIVVNESLYSRFLLIGLNLISIGFGVWFFRKLRIANFDEKHIKPIALIYIVLSALAIVLNVAGRLTLAKSFNLTGISGMVQVLSLGVFVHVLTEAMELNIRVSAFSKGLFSRINAQKTRVTFRRLLFLLSVLLWVMVFCINLNLIDMVFGFISQILEKERAFGSITFTLGNVLYFIIIIWLANYIQKNVAYLFAGQDANFTTDAVHKGSKLALIRLVIIVVGFLVAVTASGVPLSRVTVLLGALGVGIGLGMQNIVNNFVSGIILIFEKPFTIGDYIELADKKGKVLDIGIRSSKMLTSQGSQVIIPNGDLLAGRLVNYTTSDSRVKSEVTFKISADADPELARKIINEIIDQAEGIVKKAPRQILLNSIAADNIELKVLVWLDSIYTETTYKSYLLEQVLQKFRAAGIKVM